MKATHITYENKNNRQIANMVLVALKNLTGINQGTIANPFETASCVLADNRTLIQTVVEDGFIQYTDGYFIVECDDYCLYVDYTSRAISEWNLPEYKYRSSVKIC